MISWHQRVEQKCGYRLHYPRPPLPSIKAAIDVDQFMNGTNGINDVHHIIYHVMVVIYHRNP